MSYLPVRFPLPRPQAAASKTQPPDDANEELHRQAAELLKAVRQSKRPLPEAWNDVFRRRAVRSDVLATAFLQLHEAGDYETSIEGMLAAIRNDHGQPWMYDVLALQMELAGRPKKEIERVLLSRVDFAADNVAQLLVTASMLARFRDFEQALQLCREATKRDPWQVAAWKLACSLADRSKDTDSILWSRCGVLQYVWDRTFETSHQEAVARLTALASRLESEGDAVAAAAVRRQLGEARRRDLVIELLWAGDADMDLEVQEPEGQTCSFKNPRTSAGGLLVRQGDGGALGRSELYVRRDAAAGDYLVRVRSVLGRVIRGRVQLKVTRNQGTDHERTQTVFCELTGKTTEVRVPVKR